MELHDEMIVILLARQVVERTLSGYRIHSGTCTAPSSQTP